MSNRDEADADNQERWGAQVPADQYQDRPCSPESGLPYSLLEPSTGHTAEQQSVHPDDSQDDGEGDQHKAQHKEREQIPSPLLLAVTPHRYPTRLPRRSHCRVGCDV
jgi:hypothetical protein